MRCITLIERNELPHEKFRVLQGQAYMAQNLTQQAISVMED
jgi:hypothetical protein